MNGNVKDLGSCGTKRKRGSRRTDRSETKKKANPADQTSDSEMSEKNDETDEELENSDEVNDKDPMSLHEKTSWIKEQLLEEIEKLGAMLPRNALDELVDELGGPENVAEITERKGRVVQKDDGLVSANAKEKLFKVLLSFHSLSGTVRISFGDWRAVRKDQLVRERTFYEWQQEHCHYF